jgi:hypothetical protein
MNRILIFFLLLLTKAVYAQDVETPIERNRFEKVTSYSELSLFVNELDSISDLLKVEVIGKSIEGRNLYAMYFSDGEFGKDIAKSKVLIIAQQHGNEQSGKEGALILANEVLKPENRYLFSRIDLVILPQVNPDGSEKNIRRNGAGVDLNRNHLILSEPETQAIHRLFSKHLFEVTLDVHEYWPFGESWISYGYRKNIDVTMGAITNINVDRNIREESYTSFLPFLFNYISDRNFSSFDYLPGGPPDIDYLRYSTVDINDGRQSFGIQNTFSFIQEGINARDEPPVDSLKRRSTSQMVGMRGLLEYVYQNSNEINRIVSLSREKLIAGDFENRIATQTKNVRSSEKLHFPLLSYTTNRDTIITIDDFRPVIETVHEVVKPLGYLIPVELTAVVDWARRHDLQTKVYKKSRNDKLEQYSIAEIGTIGFDGDTVVNPTVTVKEISSKTLKGKYIFIPTAQLKGNLIVLALEPKSMFGLVTYSDYKHLLKSGTEFQIIRVINKR